MIEFARAGEDIAATPSTTRKVEHLAQYLRALDDADLQAASRFFTGRAFARGARKNLALGSGTIIAAAKNVWGVTDDGLAAAYREHGDLGTALSQFVCAPAQADLFTAPLTPGSLQAAFEAIAAASGKASGKRRLYIMERIFASCNDPLEAKFVIKIVTGELRIGLREGLVNDAVAIAFDTASTSVRRAVMACGDIGQVAVSARHGTLDAVRIAYGVPIGFMLAAPMIYGSGYRELAGAGWFIEDKFDGIRAQAHKDADGVALFTRTLNNVSHSYPELVAALSAIPGRFIVDGEIVAMRDGGVLPFRYLQARLQRKAVADQLLAQVPVGYMVFDVLAIGDTFLLDEPLELRKRRLDALITSQASIVVAQTRALGSTDIDTEVHAAFDGSRKRGHEGLLLKRQDARYHPGRRGKWWLKLKRELATLDVVVVAVEWGHGKRAKLLSDYTFAVRGTDGDLLTIGKAYSGLTDAEIAALTGWFIDHRLPRDRRRERARASEIPVEPTVVLEVAFDIVAKSDLHESGFALRFPRIVRIRDDKPAGQIDTIDTVQEVYARMLQREGRVSS